MTPNLTPSPPELDRLVRQTPAGMMKTATRNAAGNVVDTREYPFCCALYEKHTGHRGEMVHRLTPACKYFEAKS